MELPELRAKNCASTIDSSLHSWCKDIRVFGVLSMGGGTEQVHIFDRFLGKEHEFSNSSKLVMEDMFLQGMQDKIKIKNIGIGTLIRNWVYGN